MNGVAGATYPSTQPLQGNQIGFQERPRGSVLSRLVDIRAGLSMISQNLIEFEARLNCTGNSAKINPGPSSDYPPSSIEDVLSQIEQHLADIALAHQRLGARF